MPITKRKATGSHFTPPSLARLVADRVAALMCGLKEPIRILDPACGDGNLLCAMKEALPVQMHRGVTLIGIENDDASYASLRARQRQFGECRTDLVKGDFLELFKTNDLFGADEGMEAVDVIIANPPYVRTQVLGAERSRKLAARFGLSGRVDLYQAFLVAMSRQLRTGGIMGVITSNRFLTTRGGMATRRFLRTRFDLIEVIDLGDTKLFEAAVLPALVFARKLGDDAPANGRSEPSFIRVYEAPGVGTGEEPERASTILDCLNKPRSRLVRANGSTYKIAAGRLPLPGDDAKPWTLLSGVESQWVAAVDAACECRIGDVAKVRVGIKTTADSVFIRRDWQTLPAESRPEQRHLFPLLSQDDAAKWRPLEGTDPPRRVLYTHELIGGQRRPIRFAESSSTWKYLLSHYDKLASRTYVVGAGRGWHEIWVPQDPSAWALPKIVFPDISPDARFFLDTKGCIVDGNCYWITTRDPAEQDLLALILGIANSSLMACYHDLVFQNKLYSQRRRHLTQYISEYPLPDRSAPPCKEIVNIVRRLTDGSPARGERLELESQIDLLVAEAFDIEPPGICRGGGRAMRRSPRSVRSNRCLESMMARL